MKTLEEIVQESARAVLDYHAVEIDEDIVGNEPVNILAWEMGEGIGHETALREIVERAVHIDRAQRDIYELIAEALDDRVANDLYDDEQTARTKKAAARFRGENGGWEDDLWGRYIGPMLDKIEEERP